MIAAKKGKPSVTHWRLLDTREGRALIEFRPETGRTHQIRIHCEAGLGLPLLGDPVYGEGGVQMLLHSRFLSIARGEKPAAEATAPLPATFAAAGFGPELLDDAGI